MGLTLPRKVHIRASVKGLAIILVDFLRNRGSVIAVNVENGVASSADSATILRAASRCKKTLRHDLKAEFFHS
jgi:hypothetical protein